MTEGPKVEVNGGNTHILTVKLLDMIYQELVKLNAQLAPAEKAKAKKK